MSTKDEALAYLTGGPMRRWGWLWLPNEYPLPLRRVGWKLLGAILAAEYRVWLALPRGVFSEYRSYTLSRPQLRAGLPAHKLQTRLEQGRELRSMYRELCHTRGTIAKFLRVTPRTLFNWETGRAPVPVSVLKLLRMLRRTELPGREWQGWCFNRGTLWSPEGHGFKASDFAWLSHMIRRARLFTVLYNEREQLRRELSDAKVEAAQAHASAVAACGHVALLEMAELGALPATATGRAWRGQAAASDREVLVTPHGRLTGETAAAGARGVAA